MGGGRPGEILAYCDGRGRETREAVIERFGWTVDEYRERMTEIFQDLDPVKYGAMIDPERIIIVDAAQDNYIPRSAQDDLWEAMGRPQRISLRYSHRMAFLAMTLPGGSFVREEIWGFLHHTLFQVRPQATRSLPPILVPSYPTFWRTKPTSGGGGLWLSPTGASNGSCGLRCVSRNDGRRSYRRSRGR